MNRLWIKQYLHTIANIMIEEKEHLIDLDSVVGDGDLGLTMSDGFLAAYTAIENREETDCGKLLYTAGKAMSIAVPSTMGTLMASGLMEAGKVLKGRETLTAHDILLLFQAYEVGVMKRGKAKLGDKTFLDGFHAGINVLEEEIGVKELQTCTKNAYEAALLGYENTIGMRAIHGRAATRGEASRLLKDPGAYVGMLLMKGLAQCMAKE